jgi:hypothetical protein
MGSDQALSQTVRSRAREHTHAVLPMLGRPYTSPLQYLLMNVCLTFIFVQREKRVRKQKSHAFAQRYGSGRKWKRRPKVENVPLPTRRAWPYSPKQIPLHT